MIWHEVTTDEIWEHRDFNQKRSATFVFGIHLSWIDKNYCCQSRWPFWVRFILPRWRRPMFPLLSPFCLVQVRFMLEYCGPLNSNALLTQTVTRVISWLYLSDLTFASNNNTPFVAIEIADKFFLPLIAYNVASTSKRSTNMHFKYNC